MKALSLILFLSILTIQIFATSKEKLIKEDPDDSGTIKLSPQSKSNEVDHHFSKFLHQQQNAGINSITEKFKVVNIDEGNEKAKSKGKETYSNSNPNFSHLRIKTSSSESKPQQHVLHTIIHSKDSEGNPTVSHSTSYTSKNDNPLLRNESFDSPRTPRGAHMGRSSTPRRVNHLTSPATSHLFTSHSAPNSPRRNRSASNSPRGGHLNSSSSRFNQNNSLGASPLSIEGKDKQNHFHHEKGSLHTFSNGNEDRQYHESGESSSSHPKHENV